MVFKIMKLDEVTEQVRMGKKMKALMTDSWDCLVLRDG